MATVSRSDSRRLYSWWWDSHISPKNSKWLQENLTDMDAKVKAMIKLIEEDADSFARRAEMYYKKRPELMKLVEEFYRAYRALAERYNHATGELRHAHQTIAEVFPNQVPYDLADDSSSSSPCSEAEPIHALLDLGVSLGHSAKDLHATKRNGGYSEGSNHGISKKGLKQLQNMFGSSPSSSENLKTEVLSESERALAAEKEVQTLKTALAEILTQKEDMFLELQQNLQKLSNLESETNKADRVEIELLKEALANLEAQRDDVHFQHKQCIERLSSLQTMLSVAEEDAEKLKERASQAESEAQNLREELSNMEAEKEAGVVQYNQCLEKISLLEDKILLTEEDAGMLKQQAERAEIEVKALKEALAKLSEEKEAMALQYKQCLENIAKLENELLGAKEDAEELRREILMGAAKLKNAEERFVQLESCNHSLKSEAENLARDIGMKDQELSKKHDELEKLKMFAQDEQMRFMQIEATLQILQKLHSQSQDEQRALAAELKNGIQMLKDMESNRHGLEDEIQQVTEENQSLNEINLSSANTIQNLQNEIASLKGVKEKLEEEFSVQAQTSNVLHQEIYKLKEEIRDLNRRYQSLVAQLESVGISPDCLSSSLKGLQDENSKLKEICRKEMDEREVLYEKLKDMDKLLEENAGLSFSLSGANNMLEGSREKVKELQESHQFLQGEKSGLVAEKGTLLSQLQVVTENMQMLLERNTLLETSLSGANAELEGLRVKSKHLEEFCQLLTHEKSNLLNERSNLVSQLENVKERLGVLENGFTKLEEKYAGLEMENQTSSCQVQELRSSLSMEKQERESYMQSNQVRLVGLENHVQLLQQESRLSKKEFEEQLDKAVNAQVEIFVLQKFIKDLEEKNLSIRMECQKHVETSKLSEKLISELETENLEQQVEVEFLLDEIEKLRLGIHQVFGALQMVPDSGHENWIEQEQIPLSLILNNIEGLKSSLLSSHDDKQLLLIENSVLLTLLEQQRLDGSELVSEKTILGQEFDIMNEQCEMLLKDKHELQEMNKQLKLELIRGEQQGVELKVEMESLCVKLVDMEGAYQILQDEYSKVLVENSCLVKKFSDLTEEMHVLEEENVGVIQETVALSNLSLVFNSFGAEKVAELKAITDDLNHLHAINCDLTKEIKILGQRLEVKEAENLHLSESAQKLDKELDYVGEFNGHLNHELSTVKDFLRQKETEFSDAVQKLEATKNLNMELCRTIEELKKECEKSKLVRENAEKQINELSEDNTNQQREIEQLRQLNGDLESEVDILCKEIEECRIREENLSSELQERSNEFELWEAEAATFYFDMQISSVREVLLEDKIQELTGVCGSLEEESSSKSVEIEKMKGRVSVLQSEIGGLKAKLSAYAPAIASLQDDIASLEYNALRRTSFSVSRSQRQKDTGSAIHPAEMSSQEELRVDQCASAPEGISDLQKMQARIRAVEKAVVEEKERFAVQKRSSTHIKREAAVKETEDLKSAAHEETILPKEKMEVEFQLSCKTKPKKTQPKVSEGRNGILMKDILLDQASNSSSYGVSRRRNRRSDDHMLELWETVEQDPGLVPMGNETLKFASASAPGRKSRSSSPELEVDKELSVDKLEVLTSSIELYEERNKKKILERLASDAKKLLSLQTTLRDFKKSMTKKDKYNEYGTVRLQLQQVEEAVMELVDFNHHLTKTIEERPSSFNGKNLADSGETRNIHLNRLAEQARRGSEKIGRLQFEVQSIQYLLLKLEDEKAIKGKSRFPVSKSSVFVKIFLSSGSRTSRRVKKGRFCGCVRPSTN